MLYVNIHERNILFNLRKCHDDTEGMFMLRNQKLTTGHPRLFQILIGSKCVSFVYTFDSVEVWL